MSSSLENALVVMKFPFKKYIFLHETEAEHLTRLPKPMKDKETCAAPF